MRWCNRLTGLGVMLGLGAWTATAGAVSVGVNFRADVSVPADQTLAPADVAGVVPQPNWNNAPAVANGAGAVIAAGGLVDSNGATLGAMNMSWNAPSVFSHVSPIVSVIPGDNNPKLIRGYLDQNSGADDTAFTKQPITVTLNTIPYSAYDLIVIFDGSNDTYPTHNRVARFRLFDGVGTGGTLLDEIWGLDLYPVNYTGAFTEATGTSDQGILTSQGNYVKFTGITSSTVTIESFPGDTLGAFPDDPFPDPYLRAPINALQIVAPDVGQPPNGVPEPVTAVLVMMSVAAIGLRRNRTA